MQEERDVLIPRDKLSVYEYAEQVRILSGMAGTRFHGKWSTSFCPFQREPMEALSDMNTREVWQMACAQSGKTEVGFNLFARTVEEDPGLTMIVMPTENDTRDRIKRLFRPTFKVMPSLLKHLPGGRISEINCGTATELDNMLLFLAWAGSATVLADKAAPVIICDEVGKWGETTGKESDSVNLLRDRQTTYKDVSKMYGPSTPVMAGTLIEREFLAGDQRKWWVKCSFCDQRHITDWGNVFLVKDSAGKLLSKRDYEMGKEECSWYICPHCEKKWDETLRWQAVLRGKWAPRDCKVNPAGKIIGKVFTDPHRSYHISAMMLNPAIRTTSNLAAEWASAQDQKKKGKLKPLQNFINSRLGECWKEPGAQADEDIIRLRVSDEFSARTVPNDCQLLVGGADYHVDHDGNERLDYVITGYGPSDRNYDVIVGSVPSFEHLENEVFRTRFPWADTDLEEPEMVVSLLAVDAGFEQKPVYDFCDKWKGVAIPTKGASHPQRSPVKMSPIKPDNKRRKSRRIVKPGTLYIFDPKHFKDIVFRYITSEIDGPGSTRFYAECPKWYLAELRNEQRVKVTKAGQVSWQWQPVKEHAQVHGLDIKVLSTVAGYLQGAQHIRPANERTRQAKQPTSRKPGGGFLDNIQTIRR